MIRMRFRCLAVLAFASSAAAQVPARGTRSARAQTPAAPAITQLPTGVHLDPIGRSTPTGSFPLTMLPSPEGDRIVLLLSGWREQGVQVLDRASGRILQTLVQPAGFLGAAFSPDGKVLYASGANTDVVYRYDWSGGEATLRDSLVLATRPTPRAAGRRYPAGLAPSRDGRLLYVAENLDDSLAVVDVATGRVVQRLATERYPYAVAVGPDGTVYVSAWGGRTVSFFRPAADGLLADAGRVAAGRHPSAILLNRDGSRLFVASGSTDQVAVLDTKQRRVVARLLDPPPAGPDEGSTPNALALSPDGTRLFVAEADANAVAVFDLAPTTANLATARGDDRLAGRIPTGWYPTAVLASADTLLVGTAKGAGSAPNPRGPQPLISELHQGRGEHYTLGQLRGSFLVAPVANATGSELAALTARVSRANGWETPRAGAAYPPFRHVIYVIKENRTYDQVLGDMRDGDGDTSLVFFPRAVSPNHHALAERFGLFDRFLVNAEVSADGHNWSTAAYAADYVEKTVQSNYSSRRRWYDYEGTNRDSVPEDDVNEPANGYLWNLAERKGITFRNYGEFVVESPRDADDPLPPGYRGDKPFLYAHTDPRFAGFDLTIPDQRRADEWIAELQAEVRSGQMPALQILRLPNDHTAGAAAGMHTPRALMADNDLALGRVVEALSRTPFWRNTVVFVLEDDAQNGPDHVDSHRSPLLVISAYNRPGTIHRFANTTDVLRTIEEILGLQSLAHFDYYGRPLRGIWAATPDLRPYRALTPSVSLDEMNPRTGRGARESRRLDLGVEDVADVELFNHILWRAIRPNVPYPGTRRLSALELKRDP